MDDEQPDHHNRCPSRRPVVPKVFIVLRENDGDDEVGEGHAKGSDC